MLRLAYQHLGWGIDMENVRKRVWAVKYVVNGWEVEHLQEKEYGAQWWQGKTKWRLIKLIFISDTVDDDLQELVTLEEMAFILPIPDSCHLY